MRVLRLGPVVDQAVLQREVIRSISGTGWDRCGIGVLILGPMSDAAALIATPMAARTQPVMPRSARGEKAAGAVWAVDIPLPRHRSARLTEPGPSGSNPPAAMQADWAG